MSTLMDFFRYKRLRRRKVLEPFELYRTHEFDGKIKFAGNARVPETFFRTREANVDFLFGKFDRMGFELWTFEDGELSNLKFENGSEELTFGDETEKARRQLRTDRVLSPAGQSPEVEVLVHRREGQDAFDARTRLVELDATNCSRVKIVVSN